MWWTVNRAEINWAHLNSIYEPSWSLPLSAAWPVGKIVLTKMPMLPLGESLPPTIEKPKLFLPGPFSKMIVWNDAGTPWLMLVLTNWLLEILFEFGAEELFFWGFLGKVQNWLNVSACSIFNILCLLVMFIWGIFGKSLLGLTSTMDRNSPELLSVGSSPIRITVGATLELTSTSRNECYINALLL